MSINTNILKEVTSNTNKITKGQSKIYKFKNTFKNSKKLKTLSKEERCFLSHIEKENKRPGMDNKGMLNLKYEQDVNYKNELRIKQISSTEDDIDLNMTNSGNTSWVLKTKSLQFDDFVQAPKSTSTPKLKFNPFNLNNTFTSSNSNLIVNTSSSLQYEISKSHLRIKQSKQGKNYQKNNMILNSPLFDKDKKIEDGFSPSSFTSNITFNGDSSSINATYFYSND